MLIKNILMVEDEFLLLDCIAGDLEEAGLIVHRAMTAEGALDILRGDAELDLLFTDIRMPGEINGWDLAELARKLRPSIKVLYASGHSDVAARRVPGSLYTFKPYRVFALLKAMEALDATSHSTASA